MARTEQRGKRKQNQNSLRKQLSGVQTKIMCCYIIEKCVFSEETVE